MNQQTIKITENKVVNHNIIQCYIIAFSFKNGKRANIYS